MRLTPILLILCLVASSVVAEAGSTLTGTMRAAHFAVRYDPRDPFLAKLMAETAEDELARISRDLGYTPDKARPFPLDVYPSHVGFIKAGGLETSKYTVGTATNVGERISVDASGMISPAETVLAHEITHAVIFRILGRQVGALPLWLNEGLAKYESREATGMDDNVAAEAAAEGAIIPLSSLTTAFPETRSALAYAESSSAVRFLARKHGRAAPRVLLAELARTGSFDRAMIKATGRTGDEFIDAWTAEIDRRYHALRTARIWAAVGSVVMAALAVLAYIARRRKMIEAARQWEEEEHDRRMRGYIWQDDEE